MRLIKAMVTGMHWEAGGSSFWQGGSRDSCPGRIVAGGYGSYIIAVSSHLVLDVKIEGEDNTVGIWVERHLRSLLEIPRITSKLREIAASVLPSSVFVEKNRSGRGTVYYTTTEDELAQWCVDIIDAQLAKLTKKPRKRRQAA